MVRKDFVEIKSSLQFESSLEFDFCFAISEKKKEKRSALKDIQYFNFSNLKNSLKRILVKVDGLNGIFIFLMILLLEKRDLDN